ncbi:MAG: PucR family transcriptional regulator [Firmicutes bacterium]|nr:PucR family transcriptional regulator [Bacillota bacterium]
MNNSVDFTVENMLKLPQLEHALLIAGKGGLGRTIKWVHVLEHIYTKDFVNGHELVLTTGACWKNNRDPSIFLDQLIDKNVSALCIQLGSKYNKYRTYGDIPKKLIEKADANNFPLIVFPEHYDCRFIDLIHDIHSVIINQGYKQFLNQEQFLDKLHQIMLNIHDINDILNYLHSYLDLNVVYIDKHRKPIYIPKQTSSEQDRISELIKKMRQGSISDLQRDNLSIACRDVNNHEQDPALIAIYSNQRRLTSFEHLILDKCAINLAKVSFENLLVQEKERRNRDQWVKKWIAGQMSIQAIEKKLLEDEPFYNPTGCVACLISFPQVFTQKGKQIEKMHRLTGIARSFLEQKGFKLLSLIEKHSIVFILTSLAKKELWKANLISALDELVKELSAGAFLESKENILISVGEIYPELDKLELSYKNAQDTFYVQNKFENSYLLFYDDLQIYRAIIALEKSGDLTAFIEKYLGPLLSNYTDADQMLIKTLTALRDNQYNKIEAAKSLHISRQSIYLRIKTLESLLGDNFLSLPRERICLETALYGLEYLQTKQL